MQSLTFQLGACNEILRSSKAAKNSLEGKALGFNRIPIERALHQWNKSQKLYFYANQNEIERKYLEKNDLASWKEYNTIELKLKV